jgi:methionine-rich copper-binding protein CopC
MIQYIRLLHIRTIAALVVLAFLLLLPELSLGHAFPDHSSPKVGETLSTPPAGAYIWFDGELEPAFSKITVQDANGKRVDQGNGRVNPSNSVLLEVGLPLLPRGAYRVIWQVVSRDGHRISGDYTFAIK